MNFILFAMSLLVNLTTTNSFASENYPTTPDSNLTPGSLCKDPTSFRYEEQIPYCSRNVSKGTKDCVIRNYDTQLGFDLENIDRGEIKIDHYIPLCMGGSNEVDNLWPQYRAIFELTDKLEEVSCKKMAYGKLLQAEAVRIMRLAKTHPENAEKWTEYVENL